MKEEEVRLTLCESEPLQLGQKGSWKDRDCSHQLLNASWAQVWCLFWSVMYLNHVVCSKGIRIYDWQLTTVELAHKENLCDDDKQLKETSETSSCSHIFFRWNYFSRSLKATSRSAIPLSSVWREGGGSVRRARSTQTWLSVPSADSPSLLTSTDRFLAQTGGNKPWEQEEELKTAKKR